MLLKNEQERLLFSGVKFICHSGLFASMSERYEDLACWFSKYDIECSKFGDRYYAFKDGKHVGRLIDAGTNLDGCLWDDHLCDLDLEYMLCCSVPLRLDEAGKQFMSDKYDYREFSVPFIESGVSAIVQVSRMPKDEYCPPQPVAKPCFLWHLLPGFSCRAITKASYKRDLEAQEAANDVGCFVEMFKVGAYVAAAYFLGSVL